MAPAVLQDEADLAQRLAIFRQLAPLFGKVLPASFFRAPGKRLTNVDRIHPLIEGIYKPAWSQYAFCIASMLKSPYSDQVSYNPDRTWSILYSAKRGGMGIAANASLVRCMTDRQPVLVLKQLSDKTGAQGARYRLLGLGQVQGFDHETELFRMRGLDWDQVSQFLGLGISDDLLETALRLESLEQWAPFLQEDRTVYRVSAEKRDGAFRGIVLENYQFTCAVTGQRFRSPSHVEAAAAHIIGKAERGTDDPRNGLALSQSAHWAFDRGMFTISDQYEVMIHPKVRSANVSAFPLFDLHGQKVNLPDDSSYWPHHEALEWHRKERFDRFQL